MKQEPTSIRSLASTVGLIPSAAMACFRSLVIVLVALGLSQSAHSSITMQSYWQLGEGAAIGTDSASGTSNPFNKTDGSTILTATPSGAAGSTAYAHTSGVNFQGIWMFGAGSVPHSVPADDWGVQFNVRATALPATGAFQAVYGMLDAASGGLVIEANNIGGTTYFDVNRSGQANLIIRRDGPTTVALGTWYNLALVRSGGVLTFYVNGASVGTSTGSIGTTDGLLALGFQQGVGTRQLAGDFDEARFFTFAPGAFATSDLSMTKRTVTYDGNGYTGGTAPVDGSSYFPGTSVTVTNAGTLTRSGYVFTGWNTLPGGGGTSYSPAATFNIGDANTTLYAQWAAATATISAPATFPAGVSTTYGTASGSTSVAVSGTSLSGDITATAPGNLEVSSDNITFGATATFTQSGGNASGTLYVRLAANAPVSASPYDSQSVTLSSSGATPVTVATTASGNTVTPKALTVPSATAQDKMHDASTTGTVIGTLQSAEAFGSGNSSDGIPYIGDTVTVSAPGTFSSSAVGGPYAVTAGTFTLGGSSAGNYSLTQPTGLTLSASILNTATWTQLAGGTWTNSANWLNGIIGTGADNTANFSTLDLTAPATVTLSGPQTIGGLIFGDTTPDNNWIVSGSTLTLAASTTPVINVSDQTTTISSALASANGMSKTGAGILALSSITSGSMDLTANNGTLNLAVPFGGLAYNNTGGLANGGTLTVNSGATLQISAAYNIGYNQAVNINDGTLNLSNNITGDGQNYTLNLNFTNGGFITSSTGSSLRWGELADATITVNGTTPAMIGSILRMIPGNSRTGTINVVDAGGNLDFYGSIIDYPGIPGGVPLIKTGAGTLTLGGTNDYTSNTTVNAGTLTLAAGAQLGFTLGATSGTCNSLSGAGTVILDGNFAINTAAASALTTGTWTLENVPSLAGAYGVTFTVVGFTDAGSDKWTKTEGSKLWTFDETTGVLTLSAASYTSWIDSFTFALGADKTPTGDPDNDGINNATEMVLGGDPATGMDAALAPSIELVNTDLGAGSTNYLLFTFRRTDLSVTAALIADAQYGTNLSNWTTAVDGVGGVVVQVDDNFAFVPASPNTDRVRVYVPRGSNTGLFGRLDVTVP
jgi:uncharacterized repeat protein (TIGR02543 family)